jgi:hypothetical protein
MRSRLLERGLASCVRNLVCGMHRGTDLEAVEAEGKKYPGAGSTPAVPPRHDAGESWNTAASDGRVATSRNPRRPAGTAEGRDFMPPGAPHNGAGTLGAWPQAGRTRLWTGTAPGPRGRVRKARSLPSKQEMRVRVPSSALVWARAENSGCRQGGVGLRPGWSWLPDSGPGSLVYAPVSSVWQSAELLIRWTGVQISPGAQEHRRVAGTGRRARLKPGCPRGRAGSSPVSPTVETASDASGV